MATEGPFTPVTFSDDSAVGTIAWTNPTNAGASDNSRAIADPIIGSSTFLTVKIVKAGVVSGNNLASGEEITTTDTYVQFGGAGNTGGLSLTGADVKDATFGFVIQTTALGGQSHYLKGLDIPFATVGDGETVTGVLIEVEVSRSPGGSEARVDHARMTIYYTPTPPPGPPVGTMSMMGVGK